MHTHDIVTARLRLVTITPQMLQTQQHRITDLPALVHAEVPPGWPNDDWEPHVYEFLQRQLREHPHTLGWHRYAILPEPTPTLIGALGAYPKEDGEAEIGYGILEPWQRRGYATEAARALIAHLFSQEIHRVRAQTFPYLSASLRVMAKCGMSFAGPGEEVGAVCYTVKRDDFTIPSS